MGFYIECDAPKNKAQQLNASLGAFEVSQNEAEMIIKEDMGAVICVVDNGPFEAAAYCYNLDEFRSFTHPDDDRPKTWLVVDDTAKVRTLSRYPG